MKITKIKTLIISILLLGWISSVEAVNPWLNWNTVESEHFQVHYADGYESYTQHVVDLSERAYQKLTIKLQWQPADKIHLIISDETDQANGYATSIPFNRSVIFIASPNSPNGLEDFDDWLNTLITHELTHVLHLDKAHGSVAGLRNVFGRQFLLFPNAYQPLWLVEGLATYYETENVIDVAGHESALGTGRGQSTLYKMMMAVELEGGIKPVGQVNLPLRSWPVGTSSYLYGVYFYQFLDEVYGTAAIQKLINHYSDNVIPFSINNNSQKVLGKNISTLWKEYENWLKIRFKHEALEQGHEMDLGHRITHSGYQKNSMAMLSNGDVLFVDNPAFGHAKLKKIMNSGFLEKSMLKEAMFKEPMLKEKRDVVLDISDVHTGASVNSTGDEIVISQNEFCGEYYVYSDIYIFEKDNEDELERLTECGRYRSVDRNHDGSKMVAIKLVKGFNYLVLLNDRGQEIDTLWSGNKGEIVTQVRMSPISMEMLASVFRPGSGWNIEIFNIETKTWLPITRDPYIDMAPSYSNNGQSILFSSERSGRYQIYKVDGPFVQREIKLKQLTNVKTGAFSPLQLDSNSPLYYLGYHVKGYDVYKLDKAEVLFEENINNALSETILVETKQLKQAELSNERSYAVMESMSPRWWLPHISLTEDRSEYGISTSASDALGLHYIDFNLAYDTNNQWFVGRSSYSFANRFAIGLQRSTELLRDSNGNYALARQENDAFAVLSFSVPAIEDHWQFRLGAIMSESSDKWRADNILPIPDTNDNLLGAAVIYSSSKQYFRSISEADGRRVRLITESSDKFESDYSGEAYILDWREYMSLGGQHVLAIRLLQAWGTDQPKPFRLGGEDNEYGLFDFITPLGEPIFDKRKYALRGYEEGLAALRGRRMQLASLEWRFPGQLIERGWMSPPLGLIQWSGKVFFESGAAYNDTRPEQYYSSVGIELEADVNLFYRLTTRMRLGFASGLDEFIGEERMYFNLGTSF